VTVSPVSVQISAICARVVMASPGSAIRRWRRPGHRARAGGWRDQHLREVPLDGPHPL